MTIRRKPRTLGWRIWTLRTNHQLTLTEFSTKTGIAKSYLSQLETGNEINPSLLTLRLLAKNLHTTVGYLIGEVKFP